MPEPAPIYCEIPSVGMMLHASQWPGALTRRCQTLGPRASWGTLTVILSMRFRKRASINHTQPQQGLTPFARHPSGNSNKPLSTFDIIPFPSLLPRCWLNQFPEMSAGKTKHFGGAKCFSGQALLTGVIILRQDQDSLVNSTLIWASHSSLCLVIPFLCPVLFPTKFSSLVLCC